MKTIKIIDLLNKIANGEQPKKIKYCNIIYNFEEYKSEVGYINKDLNDEVEIIEEEKKIPKKTKIELLEESDNWCIYNGDYHITDYKINPEILDKINSNNTKIQKKLDEIMDFLKSKGDE